MNISKNRSDVAHLFIYFMFIYLFILLLLLLKGSQLEGFITKTRIYNFNPLKSHFNIVKLGFTGVYTIFLILLKTYIVGTHKNCLAETVLTSTTIYILSRNMKNIRIFLSEFSFFGSKIFNIFE